MSIHYLLDGYNIIHQMPSALSLTKLEDQRGHLIRFIEGCRPQGSVNNRVTIVFDGRYSVYGGIRTSAAKVVFSHGESADDAIKRIVAGAENAKNIIVVSDDRSIQYAVRALGARTSGTQAFLKKGNDKGRGSQPIGSRPVKERSTGRPPETEKYISRCDESRITSEFSRIWLDPRRKRKKQPL